MSNLLGPFAIVAVVLVVGGVFKLRDPAPTHDLLRSLGLPASNLLARALGAGEVILGSAAVLVGGRVLALVVAVAFTAFTVISLRLARAGTAASCGCFGKASSPPSALHVATNAASAVVALAAAGSDTAGLITGRAAFAGEPLLLATTFAGIALGSWLLVAAVTVLPNTLGAARRGPRAAPVPTFDIGRSS